MSVAAQIRSKIEAGLGPCVLEIDDQSARHIGHAGARAGGESHFQVTVISDGFQGLSQVARHRLVYGLLAEVLSERVHALSLVTRTFAESAQKDPPRHTQGL